MGDPYVFVYGTLKRGHGNHHLLKGARFLGTYRIPLPFKMVDLGGYPALVADKKRHVIHGELYAIDEDHLRALDALEEYPIFYDRITIDVEGKRAYLYVLKDLSALNEATKVVASGLWT